MPANSQPVVHVLQDDKVARNLKGSLDEAEHDDTVGLEDAYAYWMYHARKGEHTSSVLGRILLPASIGALVASLLTRFFTHKQEHSTSVPSNAELPEAKAAQRGSRARSADYNFLGKTHSQEDSSQRESHSADSTSNTD